MMELTARELAERMARGETSAEAVATAFLDSIRRRDAQIGAFLHVDADSARAHAA